MSTASKSFTGEGFPRSSDTKAAARGRPASAWLCLQIVLAYGLLEGALWTLPGRWAVLWMSLTALCILFLVLTGPYTAKQAGFGVPTITGIAVILGGGIALAAALPLLAFLTGAGAAPTHTLTWHSAWGYAIWALIQQFMLQSFFYVRLETLLGSRGAVWAATILFAAAHIPNTVLTLVTLPAGLLFCELFRRYRNLPALGVAHAMLGLTMGASFSDSLLHHMRVGIGYVAFHS